jgi:hypothetical protein
MYITTNEPTDFGFAAVPIPYIDLILLYISLSHSRYFLSIRQSIIFSYFYNNSSSSFSNFDFRHLIYPFKFCHKRNLLKLYNILVSLNI